MSDPLKISEATALALHAAVHIAGQDNAVTTAEIAESMSASPAHLAKVLQRLVRAKLLIANRGRNGGYRLAREADGITLGHVYEALEGAPRSDGCLFAAPVCRGSDCIMGEAVERARRELWEYLSKTSIKELAELETKGGTR